MTLLKKIKSYDKYTKLSIILIIFFSTIIFTLTSIHHVSGDACWHLSVARFIAEEQKIPLNQGLGRDEPFWAPPLFHIISAFVYSIFKSDFIIKFISPTFAILILIFTFLITKKLFNTKIAFYTLIFLAFIPIFIDYSIFSYVESTLLFFIVLSIYFAINNKVILASISAGLGVLTKYNALFIIPLLIYIIYKNNRDEKNLTKNISIMILLPIIIASPWFIRNWIVLGNPIWPFLNFIFNSQIPAFNNLDLSRLIDIDLIIYTYLGLFGVPNGNPQNLFFFKIPFLSLLITIWLIGTLIFILPLIYSKKLKNKNLITIWISSYLILFLLYVTNVSFGVTRIILPAMPAIAMIWAHGFDRLLNLKYHRNQRFIGHKKSTIFSCKKLIPVFLILIICGFIFTEFIKITLAANEWNFYEKDFEWVKTNTERNVIFIAGGQCLSYNLNRRTLYPSEKNIEKSDYIWINQNFRLDRRSILDEDLFKKVQNKEFNIVYQNSKTKTIIYKTK